MQLGHLKKYRRGNGHRKQSGAHIPVQAGAACGPTHQPVPKGP